jgi:hypothetical protein
LVLVKAFMPSRFSGKQKEPADRLGFSLGHGAAARGAATDSAALPLWRRHASLSAVKGRWRYMLNGDAVSRQGLHIADAAMAMCGALDPVRRERRIPTR